MAITLTGKQQEVLALPAKGHIVVLGTAGSGKTTMLCIVPVILPTFRGAAGFCLSLLIALWLNI